MSIAKTSLVTGEQATRVKPFLKWAGGKRQLLDILMQRLPQQFKNYHEPFLGGGALFFALGPTRAILSDLNDELINTYQVVRERTDELIHHLKQHEYSEEYFYFMRAADREPGFSQADPVFRASRFIFLNKTCFNGLHRVNSRGHFNTPFGRYTNPTIVDEPAIRACARALENAELGSASFHSVLDCAQAGDFVYLDPPYQPISTTASFTQYAAHGFDRDAQETLLEVCRELNRRGVYFLQSNSYTQDVCDSYAEFEVERVAAKRAINSKGSARGVIPEALIRNY